MKMERKSNAVNSGTSSETTESRDNAPDHLVQSEEQKPSLSSWRDVGGWSRNLGAAGAFRRPLLSSCARDRGRIGEKTPNFRHHGHGHESDALRFEVLLSLILITDDLVETMHELLSSALGCLRSEQGLQRPLVDMYQKTTRSVPTA